MRRRGEPRVSIPKSRYVTNESGEVTRPTVLWGASGETRYRIKRAPVPKTNNGTCSRPRRIWFIVAARVVWHTAAAPPLEPHSKGRTLRPRERSWGYCGCNLRCVYRCEADGSEGIMTHSQSHELDTFPDENTPGIWIRPPTYLYFILTESSSIADIFVVLPGSSCTGAGVPGSFAYRPRDEPAGGTLAASHFPVGS